MTKKDFTTKLAAFGATNSQVDVFVARPETERQSILDTLESADDKAEAIGDMIDSYSKGSDNESNPKTLEDKSVLILQPVFQYAGDMNKPDYARSHFRLAVRTPDRKMLNIIVGFKKLAQQLSIPVNTSDEESCQLAKDTMIAALSGKYAFIEYYRVEQGREYDGIVAGNTGTHLESLSIDTSGAIKEDFDQSSKTSTLNSRVGTATTMMKAAGGMSPELESILNRILTV